MSFSGLYTLYMYLHINKNTIGFRAWESSTEAEGNVYKFGYGYSVHVRAKLSKNDNTLDALSPL